MGKRLLRSIGGLVIVGIIVVVSYLYLFSWELPIDIKLILFFSAISAFVALASKIEGIYNWIKAKQAQGKIKKIVIEAKSKSPKVTIHGVWGPYGKKEKATDCFELKRNSTEFLTINIYNKKESGEIYSFKSEIVFPEGFELLMEGDVKLDRPQLGNTRQFIDDLVGKGNPPGYRFLPEFGGDRIGPKDIQHDRRIFRQRRTSSRIGPGSTFVTSFWVRTPIEKIEDGKIHIRVSTILFIPGSNGYAEMKTVEHKIGIKTA